MKLFFYDFRKILKNPVRRLSLKDTKDIKTSNSHDLITHSPSDFSKDSSNVIRVNKRPPLPSNSTASRKIKVDTKNLIDDYLISF
jgi:hypothetical protein